MRPRGPRRFSGAGRASAGRKPVHRITASAPLRLPSSHRAPLAVSRANIGFAVRSPASRAVRTGGTATMSPSEADISKETPKILTVDAVRESDVCVTMGCGDTCPVFPGKRYLDWKLEDPAGQGVEAVRPIRDEIKTRIEGLIAEIAPAEPEATA
ncbi:phosphotyrosine protein phosphatase [Streptomyces sp. NPDC014623]|uniref:phosphotyrosine protein phosphatase n=1 Tax=Streptomyces sp. NPDC014623 TaxID=3364875 RepID=UPI003702C5CB